MAKHNKNRDYAYLNHLSTEQLEELLQADVDSLGDSNNDIIFHILEVIEEREKENPTGRLPNVDRSWEEFKKYYNTPEGDGLSLYPNECRNEPKPAPAKVVQKRRNRLRHFIVTAAAMICLAVFAVPPALGYGNIFEIIAHWTAEQFSFGEISESPDSDSQTNNNQVEGEYTSLQDALAQYGIDDIVVPQSIPGGFQLKELWVQEYQETGDVEFSAPYVKDDDNIIITIYHHHGQFEKNYEKNGEAVEHYVSGNVEHYIFHNNNNITAAWYVDSLECFISTTLTITELERIIDSIYEE